MKTIQMAVILTLSTMASNLVLADGTPPVTPPAPPANCVPLRTAKAKVTINKMSITQENGAWKTSTQLICSSTGDINVYQDAKGCGYTPVLRCEATLDGTPHVITANGLIWFANPTALKVFGAQYYIDRNYGEAGSSAVTSQNLTQNQAGLIINTSRAKTADQTAFSDSLNINVSFDDQNAQ